MDKIILNHEHCELTTIEQYISFLNEPRFAADFINVYNMVSDSSFMGEYISIDKNKFRIYPNSSFNPLIYRGENKIYKNFIPSFLRIDINSIEHAIEWIKKQEFIELIKISPYNTYLTSKDNLSILDCSFDIDLEAIAQHYEFATNYLDFSTDMLISMFFAYTQCIEPGNYIPIEDFSKYNPVLYVGDIKKIFQETDKEKFKIIGFQPASRPTIQKALAFEFDDVKNDFISKFIKIELPKSTYMSIGIFEHFQRGKALFPKDLQTEFSKRIRDKYIISEYINLYCEKFKKNIKDVQNKLINEGYEITNRKTVWSQNDYNFMNYEIKDYLLPWMYQNIGYRKTSKSI